MKLRSLFSVLTLIMVTTLVLTSCLSSGDKTRFDELDYMTIDSDGSSYVYSMTGDILGKPLIPINPEKLKIRKEDGTLHFPDRARVYYSYVTDDKKDKTSNKVKVEAMDLILTVKSLNFQKDTLVSKELDHDFIEVGNPWGASNFISVIFNYKHYFNQNISSDQFDLYVSELDKSKVTFRFNDSRKIDDFNTNPVAGIGALSYKMPDRGYFSQFSETFEPFGPNNDSITVVVETRLASGIKKLKEFNMKLGRN